MDMKALAVLGVVALVAGRAGAATVYSTEAEFLSVINSGYYLEDFDTLSGVTALWDAPGANGFDFYAEGGGGVAGWGTGYPTSPSISANWVDGDLLITFSGAPVTALGAYFQTKRHIFNTDQMNIITLSDGTVEQFPGFGFRGFTSDVPITTLHFVGSDDPGYAYGWLDHLYVGQIPAPGAACVLVAGGVLAGRRRRS
ncbi:MAG: hypothetical protein GIKADHBN_01501 [Phycisphaerales bacterium]|nr:hypothetical protein [Phycisphaerales bacterium]